MGHINKLSKKLSSATGILNRIKDNIPSELHKNLYHTLFESHLAYGIITAWVVNNCSHKTYKKIYPTIPIYENLSLFI